MHHGYKDKWTRIGTSVSWNKVNCHWNCCPCFNHRNTGFITNKMIFFWPLQKRLYSPTLKQTCYYIYVGLAMTKFGSHILMGHVAWCTYLVTWFCYQMIAKPGNKAVTPPLPGPCTFLAGWEHCTRIVLWTGDLNGKVKRVTPHLAMYHGQFILLQLARTPSYYMAIQWHPNHRLSMHINSGSSHYGQANKPQ